MKSTDHRNTQAQDQPERLFAEFPSVSYNQWRTEAERLLKGAPFDKKMLTATDEGIVLQPIYGQEDLSDIDFARSFPGLSPFVRGGQSARGRGHDWLIAQEIMVPDCGGFNEALRHDIARGLTAIHLPLDYASRKGYDPDQAKVGDVGYDGVSIASKNELRKALDGAPIDSMPVYIQSGTSGAAQLGLFIALAKERGVSLASLAGAIAMDPLGEIGSGGKLPALIDSGMDDMANMTVWAIEHAPGLGTIWVHGEPYHDGGAHGVMEMAAALATAVYYLRQIEARGVDLEQAASHFRFSFGIGSHMFMEIAKLRAARLLWNRILESCGIAADRRGMWIHARTSRYNKTVYDPYVNMLRTTTEAFAGVVGGADSLHVAPFDECIREADEFSRRIARNTQIILKEEAHLAQTIDPAGGSWYVEKLTFEMAEKGWEAFVDIESRGGMYQVLKDGYIQNLAAESARTKSNDLALRKKIAVGTNQYPNATEQPLKVPALNYEDIYSGRAKEIRDYHRSMNGESQTALKQLEQAVAVRSKSIMEGVIEAAGRGATVGEIMKTLRGNRAIQVEIAPLPSQRRSYTFEYMRSAIEKRRAERGGMRVFLATLGPVGRYMPRLDFAASFFEVGGFDVARTEGFKTPAEAAKRALEANAEVVVICGLDESYETGVPETAKAIKTGKKKVIVIVAGMPKDATQKRVFEEAGVDLFIHIKSNILRELRDIAFRLGVQS